jgi:hypothetical protein
MTELWRALSQDWVCDQMPFANGAQRVIQQIIADDKLGNLRQLRGWSVPMSCIGRTPAFLMGSTVMKETATAQTKSNNTIE